MVNKNRDDFTPTIKNNLAKRVAYIYSNPSCHKLTICPSGDSKIKTGLVQAYYKNIEETKSSLS